MVEHQLENAGVQRRRCAVGGRRADALVRVFLGGIIHAFAMLGWNRLESVATNVPRQND
jgi:hypothetical protein